MVAVAAIAQQANGLGMLADRGTLATLSGWVNYVDCNRQGMEECALRDIQLQFIMFLKEEEPFQCSVRYIGFDCFPSIIPNMHSQGRHKSSVLHL